MRFTGCPTSRLTSDNKNLFIIYNIYECISKASLTIPCLKLAVWHQKAGK